MNKNKYVIVWNRENVLISDERLMTMESISSSIEKLRQLQVYYFYANETAQEIGWDRPHTWPNGVQPRRIGVMAQDLQAVAPELVNEIEFSPGHFRVEYNQLNVLLLDAIKSLNNRLDNIKTQLGLPVSTTTTTSTTTQSSYTYTDLSADLNTSDKKVTVTLLTDNSISGARVGFKLTGNINYSDIKNPTGVELAEIPQTDYICFGVDTIINGVLTFEIEFEDASWNVGKNFTLEMEPSDSNGVLLDNINPLTVSLND